MSRVPPRQFTRAGNVMTPPEISLSHESSDAPSRGQIRVFIIDPHGFVRAGLRAVVNAEPDMTVCGESELAGFAPGRIARGLTDVVLIGASARDGRSLETIRALRRLWPGLRIIAMSLYEDAESVRTLLAAGASEFVVKVAVADKLLEAIRRGRTGAAQRGTTRGDGRAGSTTPPAKADPVPLDALERQIAGMVGHGMPTHAIAVRLRLPVRTIEARLARIREKLNLSSPVDVVEFCVAWDRGLTDRLP